MGGTTIAIIYGTVIVMFFVLLIVLTVALILSKKDSDEDVEGTEDETKSVKSVKKEVKKDKKENKEKNIDDDNDKEDNNSIFDDADSAFSDSAFGDSAFSDSAFSDSAFSDSAFGDSAFSADTPHVSKKVDIFQETATQKMGEDDEDLTDEMIFSSAAATDKLPIIDSSLLDEYSGDEKKQLKDEENDSAFGDSTFSDSAFSDSAFSDSAFGDSVPVENVLVEEVPAEGVLPEYSEVGAVYHEGVPMADTLGDGLVDNAISGAYTDVTNPYGQYGDIPEYNQNGVLEENVIGEEMPEDSAFSDNSLEDSAFTDSAFGDGVFVDSTFGQTIVDPQSEYDALNQSVKEAMAIGEALSKAKTEESPKNSRKTFVSSSDDFYWYNKMDVAEKPSYKTEEMYYHHFNIAKDCINDLVMEMYDCALVRTEEIKYIAYGIETRAVSMREILTSGNRNYMAPNKLKQPTTQDYVKIYEKWCGYVDQLFDKIEIHADDYTIEEIRGLLYEYGKNDVDVLIEGM